MKKTSGRVTDACLAGDANFAYTLNLYPLLTLSGRLRELDYLDPGYIMGLVRP